MQTIISFLKDKSSETEKAQTVAFQMLEHLKKDEKIDKDYLIRELHVIRDYLHKIGHE